jgi:hypothetical protein
VLVYIRERRCWYRNDNVDAGRAMIKWGWRKYRWSSLAWWTKPARRAISPSLPRAKTGEKGKRPDCVSKRRWTRQPPLLFRPWLVTLLTTGGLWAAFLPRWWCGDTCVRKVHGPQRPHPTQSRTCRRHSGPVEVLRIIHHVKKVSIPDRVRCCCPAGPLSPVQKRSTWRRQCTRETPPSQRRPALGGR